MEVLKTYSYDNVIESNPQQVMLDGDVIVPDVKPDIAKVLEVTYEPFITSTVKSVEKVNYKGYLEVKVLYLSAIDEVNSMNYIMFFEENFTSFEILENSRIYLKIDVIDFSYRVLNDRKISFKAVAQTSAKGVTEMNTDYVEGVKDVENADVNIETVKMCKSKMETEEIEVKDEISIKTTSKNVSEVLQCNVTMINREAKLYNNSLHISGDLCCSILFKSDDGTVDYVEKETKFTHIAESSYDDSCMIDYHFMISEYNCKMAVDEDGEYRLFTMVASINCNVIYEYEAEFEILTDLHILNKKVELAQKELPVMNYIFKNRNHYYLKDIASIKETSSNILQVVNCKCFGLIDDYEVLENKIVLNGYVNADMLYFSKDDEMPLSSENFQLPFSHTIEAYGCKNAEHISVDLTVLDISLNILNDREVEVKVGMSFDTDAKKIEYVPFVESIYMEDINEEYVASLPSVVIHFVQKDEKLIDIAKRYNSSCDDIITSNNLDSADLRDTKKLIIMKKVMGQTVEEAV